MAPKKKITLTIAIDEDAAVSVLARAIRMAELPEAIYSGSQERDAIAEAAHVIAEANRIADKILNTEPPGAKGKKDSRGELLTDTAPKETQAEPDPQDALLAMLGGAEAPAAPEYTQPEYTQPEYTHDALKLAARDWVLSAETTEEQLARTKSLNGLIRGVRAQSVSDIPAENLGVFAETLRGLGVPV